jgi:DNA-binding MarR family transcriptional regulator
MQDYQLSVLLKLYVFGKKLQALVKKHNSDLMSQTMILRMVEDAPLSVSELADALSIKVSAATSKIAEMERLDLLSRSHAKDKRSHIVAITQKGKHTLSDFKKHMSAAYCGDWFGLTKQEAETLLSYVDRIRLELHL